VIVIVALLEALLLVVMLKLAVVAPEATVTFAGTEATPELELASVTTRPAAGAGAEIVTVPTDPAAPVTVEGLRVRLVRVRGPTVMVADFELAPTVAVIDEVELVATDRPVTVKVPEVAPAAIVIVAGTVATLVLLDASVTVSPPVGAAPLIVTVPVDVVEDAIEVGLSASALTVGAVTVNVAVGAIAPEVAVITGEALAATG